MNTINSETSPSYLTGVSLQESLIIEQALNILEGRMRSGGQSLVNVNDTRDFLKLKLQSLEHEVFCVLLLDNRHTLIEFVTLTTGTIDGASVYPRELVKLVLKHNAAACIFAHNHPSQISKPSISDRDITKKLVDALQTIEVRVLDHFIVAGDGGYSFAEHGLL